MQGIQSSERHLCVCVYIYFRIYIYHLIIFSTLRIHNQMIFPPTFQWHRKFIEIPTFDTVSMLNNISSQCKIRVPCIIEYVLRYRINASANTINE